MTSHDDITELGITEPGITELGITELGITELGITELADFRTDDGADFEAAMEELKGVLASSPGYKSHRVMRSIETPGRYVLLVEWESVEDHMVGFRESERFGEWAGRIARHREGVFVEHFEPVLEHRLDQNRPKTDGKP